MAAGFTKRPRQENCIRCQGMARERVVDYGNIFLSSCNYSDLNDIKTLQNHALRCCCDIKKTIDVHIIGLHAEVKVQMVDVRRERQILTCIWRNIRKGIITITVPIRETRYNAVSIIYLPVLKTEIFKKAVY